MRDQVKNMLIGCLFLLCICILSHLLIRENAVHVVTIYCTAFAAYFALIFLWKKKSFPLFFLIGLGVIARLIAVFSIPVLSDDFWRFLWDGHLWNIGIHPFHFKPEDLIMQQSEKLNDALLNIYPNLNSKQYFTIYPPVCQAVFFTAIKLFPRSVFGGVLLLKSFLFLCELGTIFLLLKLPTLYKGSNDNQQSLIINAGVLYALNPLAIIEVCGNIHFEGAAVFFIVLALFAMKKLQKTSISKQNFYVVLSAFALSLAISSKLIPLMYAPLIFIALPWKQGLKFSFLVVLFCGLLFYPMLDLAAISGNAASIGLYFKTFEFNASVYYILRSIGTWYYGYNPIHIVGPFLGIMTLVVAVCLFFKTKKIVGSPSFKFPWKRPFSLEVSMYIVAFVYLLFSTTVHPWYVLIPFVLSLFTNSYVAMAWTALIPLTYFRYATGQEGDVYGWIALEYGLLLMVFLFLKNREKRDRFQEYSL